MKLNHLGLHSVHVEDLNFKIELLPELRRQDHGLKKTFHTDRMFHDPLAAQFKPLLQRERMNLEDECPVHVLR